MAPTSNYPTQPLSPYYGSGVSGGSTGGGSTGGGSTGSYVAPPSTFGNSTYSTNPSLVNPNPVPGTTMPGNLVFPGAPPATSAPLNNQPSVPQPSSGQPVLPSFPAAPSTDPAANSVPGLQGFSNNSRSDAKPQLQNVVQQPLPTTREFTPSVPTKKVDANPGGSSSQGLLPIPVPDDFKHEPRWNPGLLKEKDTTAANSRPAVDPQIAWGSKPIHWASHKTSSGKQPAAIEMPPAQLRERPVSEFKLPQTEIPAVNFQPPQPVNDPKIDPQGRRTDIWRPAK